MGSERFQRPSVTAVENVSSELRVGSGFSAPFCSSKRKMESFGLVCLCLLSVLKRGWQIETSSRLEVTSLMEPNGYLFLPAHSLLPLAVFNHLSAQIKVDQRWQEECKDRIEVFVCSEICFGSCVVQIALLT